MISTSPNLPIDSILPQLRQQLRKHNALVLQAQPGAGKTTRVPIALLDEPWLSGQKILLLEPRRLAAISAARFMSQTLGEKVGTTIGYTIRHERCVGKHTRIEVITEGVLTRRLQNDPMLEGVGLIIFDEFHERNIHSDLGLALSRDAQQGLREDLKLLVMSATLDTAAVAALLDDCPVLNSDGRSYPIEVIYQGDDSAPLARQVLKATRCALDEQQGDILIFLPGVREIRACQRLLGDHFASADVEILPLYGALPFAQQQHALRPSKGRKVVLATNIAETSLTIDGIGVVIDSGQERRLIFDAASGMNGLITGTISVASATQRAGRAGRVQAGTCYRLWSETAQRGLQPYSIAEICRSDLASLALELVLWGVPDVEQLAWLDVPPKAHLSAATRLLNQLGATDEHGRITSLGKQMAKLPLHPRLAAMVVRAQSPEEQMLACELAVILEEPDLLPPARQQVSTRSDLLDRLEYWRHARHATSREHKVVACERSLSALTRCLKLSGSANAVLDVDSIGRLLLAAFPDRVARRRSDSHDHYQLRSGAGARLSFRSQLVAAPWLVAAQVAFQPGGEALIHLASALEREQILDHFGEQLLWVDDVAWDNSQQRVIGRRCRKLDALVVIQRPQSIDPDLALPLLIQQIQHIGLDRLAWTAASRQWLQRARFVVSHVRDDVLRGDWPELDEAGLLQTLDQWLAPWLTNVTSLAALKKIDLLDPLHSLLSWAQQQQLDKLAPLRVQVPSGSRVAIDYSDADNPVLAVKLQELFGWQTSPCIAAGRVPLTIHLLSPARRPLQVTRDLANFWITTYPEVKKEMKGRYPKHPWPDDPLVAVAQRGVKKRQR